MRCHLALRQKYIGDKMNFLSGTNTSFLDLWLKYKIFVKKPNYFLKKILVVV